MMFHGSYIFNLLHRDLTLYLFFSSVSITSLLSAIESSRVVSMTAPPPTNAQGLDTSKVQITEEDFLHLIDTEMVKVETFTLQQVTKIRDKIQSVEAVLRSKVDRVTGEFNGDTDTVTALADEIATDFLRIELYVNLNFMGFHKILKKHDKNLPNNPCKVFYVNRLHSQAWVRGDYSDVIVRLSNIYATLRSDHRAEENKDASQSFLRSTTKYWVKTEDVSRVKYATLRHLPVFLQKTSTGESDSQFTNSVYLDNDQLELYHGRLDKTPGAIALRLRWYGPEDPTLVFVERKTHNEKWAGGVSVKERFTVCVNYCDLFLYFISSFISFTNLEHCCTSILDQRIGSASSTYQYISDCSKEARNVG